MRVLLGSDFIKPAPGFSLVELMVALALSTFLIGALILTYTSGRTAASDAEDLSRIQENMRFVSDHLLRDIRNAGFRDQLTLTFDQYEAIGGSFAQVNSTGTELTIRYAGRSHCAQPRREFDPNNPQDDLGLVVNVYSVRNQNGRFRLQCEGSWSDRSGFSQSGTTDLVDGVSEVRFALVRPDDSDAPQNPMVCDFGTEASLASACIGVEVRLTFEGIRSQREALVTGSFRNVLLDQIYGRD